MLRVPHRLSVPTAIVKSNDLWNKKSQTMRTETGGTASTAMSTKREEPCPECNKSVMASDEWVTFYDHAGIFRVRQWFYLCPCGWTWVNDVQRKNNAKFYQQALKVREEWLTEMGEVAPPLAPSRSRR